MMSSISHNLQKELKAHLKTAGEVWIIVALLTKKGLDIIENSISDKAIQHYILGIDLPTDPEALVVLEKEQHLGKLTVGMFVKQEFFHPKVYIIKTDGKYTAFIGSANCTHGALFSNIELSYIVKKQSDCKELISWYGELIKKSVELNEPFITTYRKTYKLRKERREAEEQEISKLKSKLSEEFEVTMDSRKELIRELKKYHKRNDYEDLKNQRLQDVEDLKESLDYPDFDKIDIDSFYDNWALGHLRYTPVEYLKDNKPKFRKLLKVLTDETIDVATRFNRALKEPLKVKGFNVASISKVLTMHNPSRYTITNDKIDGLLNGYGIQIPKKVSLGEQYKATSKYMIEIAKEAGFDDLAILDCFLYEETTKKLI